MVDTKLHLDAQKLKELRKKQGLSQERLAYACEKKRLRVSIATIKRAELGKLVSLRTATELAQFYNLDISELLLKNSVNTEVAPVLSQSTSTSIMPVLWLRLNGDSQTVQDVVALLKRRGCISVEPLGNTVTAVFGRFDSDGQGHLLAQRVSLEVRHKLQLDNSLTFFAALHLGAVQQGVESMLITPSVLQWFAEKSLSVPENTLIVSNEIFQVSHGHFNYQVVEISGEEFYVLEGEKYIVHTLPLIGRASELLQLNALLDGVGQRTTPAIAHITGIGGVGKSRLLNALIEQAKLRDFVIASIDLELGWDEPVELLTINLCQNIYNTACKKISSRQIYDSISNDSISDSIKYVFSHVLNIQTPFGTNECDLNITVDEALLVDALNVLMDCLIKQFSLRVVITIDNFHLAKKTGASIFSSLLARCENLPITCVVTSRLESNDNDLIKSLANQNYSFMTLSLGGISPEDTRKLCSAFDGIPDSYRNKCIAMSEGIPLYLIQLLTAYPNTDEVPSSLQVLLEQKIHGLSQVNRMVVELLSVAEIDISLALLGELISIVNRHHQDSKECDFESFDPENLVGIQIININPLRGIKLCHQLVKRTIYEGLSESSKRYYHTLLAEFLEENRGDEVGGISNIGVGRHCLGAGYNSKAAEYFYLAASELIQKGIYSDAKSLLMDALEAVQSVESKERFDIEINIQLALSGIYKVSYGWVSPLVKNAYLRIEALCNLIGGDKRLSLALFGLWTIELSTLNFKSAEKLAKRCLTVAEEYSDPQGEMHAYIALSNTLFWRGKLTQSELAARKSLELYQAAYSESSIQLLGQDPRALAGCFGAWSASLLGKDEVAEYYRNILRNDINKLNHDFSVAIGLQGNAWLDYHYGDLEGALQYAEELDRLSEEKNFPFYRGVAALFIGWAKHKLHGAADAATIVDQGYHRWLVSSGDKIAYSLYCTILAEIYLDQENYSAARDLLEKGIQFSLDKYEECYVPEMYRLLSLCVDDKQKEAYLYKGLALAGESSVFSSRINQLLGSRSSEIA